ncbi:MAG: hypothetical protein KBD78_02370 [Oligoflexales bacterium]|nr:hypothetical protein [Oligoflexales bacterium]
MKRVLGLIAFLVIGYIFFACRVYKVTENASLAGGGLSGAQERYQCSLTENKPGSDLISATVVLTDTDLGKKMVIQAKAPSWQGSASGLTTEYSSSGGGSYSSYTLNYATYGMDQAKGSFGNIMTAATFYPQLMSADHPLLYFRSDVYTCRKDVGGGGGSGPGADSPTPE